MGDGPITVSELPDYGDDEDTETVAVGKKEMKTGDGCTDKAIAAGKNPEPPSADYQIEEPSFEY